MAALYGNRQLNFKKTGTTATVPDTDLAKVMYYLKSVTKGCGLDVIQDDLVDFRRHFALSRQRADLVFVAAIKYSPDELIDKVLFQDEAGELCGTKLNDFFDVENVTTFVAARSVVLIAGQQTRLSKIMVFKKEWMMKYYVEPLQRQSARVQRVLREILSGHCEHCPGTPGRCQCPHSCARKGESRCSPSLTLSGVFQMAELLSGLNESRVSKHCSHCNGGKSKCECTEGCSVPENAECFAVHPSIVCDGCKQSPMTGTRMKCSSCNNFDLCQKCYNEDSQHEQCAFHKYERVGSSPQYVAPRKVSKHCACCMGGAHPCHCTKGCALKNESACYVKHNKRCDGGCGRMSYTGAAYKCTACDSHQVCSECYKSYSDKLHLSHRFLKIERIGKTGTILQPRVPERQFKPNVPRNNDTSPSSSTQERSVTFYNDMTISQLKVFLFDAKVPVVGISDKEELKRLVWEAHCEIVAISELDSILNQLGIDPKYIMSPSAKRERAKKAFKSNNVAKAQDGGRKTDSSAQNENDNVHFYNSMTVQQMKKFLENAGVPFSGINEKNLLKKLVWESHCDSIGIYELNELLSKLGKTGFSTMTPASKRNLAKNCFNNDSSRATQETASYSTIDSNKKAGNLEYPSGRDVELYGLRAASMNGKTGKIADGILRNGRYEIILDNNQKVKVKPENLELLLD